MIKDNRSPPCPLPCICFTEMCPLYITEGKCQYFTSKLLEPSAGAAASCARDATHTMKVCLRDGACDFNCKYVPSSFKIPCVFTYTIKRLSYELSVHSLACLPEWEEKKKSLLVPTKSHTKNEKQIRQQIQHEVEWEKDSDKRRSKVLGFLHSTHSFTDLLLSPFLLFSLFRILFSSLSDFTSPNSRHSVLLPRKGWEVQKGAWWLLLMCLREEMSFWAAEHSLWKCRGNNSAGFKALCLITLNNSGFWIYVHHIRKLKMILLFKKLTVFLMSSLYISVGNIVSSFLHQAGGISLALSLKRDPHAKTNYKKKQTKNWITTICFLPVIYGSAIWLCTSFAFQCSSFLSQKCFWPWWTIWWCSSSFL